MVASTRKLYRWIPPGAVLKLRFGFAKVRYRGLAKNLHRLQVGFALVNLVTVQKHLVPAEQ